MFTACGQTHQSYLFVHCSCIFWMSTTPDFHGWSWGPNDWWGVYCGRQLLCAKRSGYDLQFRGYLLMFRPEDRIVTLPHEVQVCCAHTTLPFPLDAQPAQPWRRRADVRERSSCEEDLGEYKRCSHSQSAQTEADLLLLLISLCPLFFPKEARWFRTFSKTLPLLFQFLLFWSLTFLSPKLCELSFFFSAPRPEWTAPRHGTVHRPGSAALPVRPLLRHPFQCHLPGRGERLDGRQAAELHRAAAAGSGEERRGDNHSHLHHGSLLRHLRGGTSGQRPRHVRSGQVKTPLPSSVNYTHLRVKVSNMHSLSHRVIETS